MKTAGITGPAPIDPHETIWTATELADELSKKSRALVAGPPEPVPPGDTVDDLTEG